MTIPVAPEPAAPASAPIAEPALPPDALPPVVAPVVVAPAVVAPATPRGPRRPVFGWIAFGFIVVAALALGVIVFYAYTQTADAFIQGPPWWAVTSQLATTPVGILCFLGLVSGIIGTARREKPGWPGITAMIFALPGFGYVALATFIWFTVTTACAGPAGACGV